MSEAYDIVIIGAGCAGLSLAWHLLDAGVEPDRLALLDPRTEYRRDRTWCFFDVWPHPFESLVTKRWARWRVRCDGPWIERADRRVRYVHLPADAFYEAVCRRLQSAGVALRLGVRASSVEAGRDAARVHTDRGMVQAKSVFDSRPPRGRARSAVSLVQHFEGWVVRSEAARFEPEVATLMDFAVPQDRGAHFLYVLPFDAHRALVEATWITPEAFDFAAHREAIRRSLGPAPYVVEHRERGRIPMTSARFARRTGRRVYHIGVSGGLAKPSTGYAFLQIQRDSRTLAAALARGELPEPREPRTWMSRFQDAVFLKYLERHPTTAGEAFTRVFERLPAELFARFLHERVSVRERVEVMRAMPALPMCAEVVRSAPSWLR